ncbi:hypothetical protein J6T21_00035 [Candidatus Saccharibacteria bacterium]|nr:hypothetical protein [Candidatus Saccharibacteria bacterium]
MNNIDISNLTEFINRRCSKVYRYAEPKITMYGRLRNVHEEHYDSFFDINAFRNLDGELIIDVVYLPEVRCNPYNHYYKSGTKKAGGFFNIKDICELHFGPEPSTGWHYRLEEVERDNYKNFVRYKVIENSR